MPDLHALTALLAPPRSAVARAWRSNCPSWQASTRCWRSRDERREDPAGRLALMLTELRLPTIKRLALDLCVQSDREGWPAQRLLEALFEHEINEREVRRIDRHRTESDLSPDKRLSSFDFTAVPSVSKAQVMALAEGHEWLDRGANVLLFGPPDHAT